MKPFLILSSLAFSGIVHAAECGCPISPVDELPASSHDCHTSSAPVSVMGDHLHAKGEWMISLRYMFMDMDGMYGGTNSVSPAQVHAANYVVSPTRMTMDMQMLGVMYAPSDDLTLMAMLPYIDSEMDHVIQGGTPLIGLNGGSPTFTTRSEGIGDLKLTALLRLKDEGRHHLHGGIGVSLPTGSIAEQDLVPGPGGRLSRQLPAAMQPGSGTIDLLPSLTYLYHGDAWSFGSQARAVIRTDKNHHGYQLGNRAEIDAWISTRPQEWLTLHGGLGFRWEDQLQGTQSGVAQRPPFAPARLTVPTAFGFNYGGMRLDGILGLNAQVADGERIGLDVRLPLWQDVDGYRLGQDLSATIAWFSTF